MTTIDHLVMQNLLQLAKQLGISLAELQAQLSASAAKEGK